MVKRTGSFLVAVFMLLSCFLVRPHNGLADDLCMLPEDGFSNPLAFTPPLVPAINSESGTWIYLNFFTPGSNVFWAGSLVKFRLGDDLSIVDKLGAAAVLSSGSLRAEAPPFWSTKDWATPGKDNYVLNSGRKIYTYLGASADLRSPTNQFSVANGGLTPAVLGGPERFTAQEVIDYVRGADVQDLDGDGNKGENRQAITADAVHSEPAVVRYAFPNPDYDENAEGSSPTYSETFLFFGSNGGMLHAVRDSDGSEAWSFVPPDQLHRLKGLLEGAGHDYYIDASPKVYLKDWNGDGVFETANATEDWNGDGAVDAADRDWVILVCGERKGGSSYFALDVTNPEAPLFLWRIGAYDDSRAGVLTLDGVSGAFEGAESINSEAGAAARIAAVSDGGRIRFVSKSSNFQPGEIVTGQTSGAAGTILSIAFDAPPGAGPSAIIPELGETWSEPQFGTVKTSDQDATGTPVFFIGGGYSENQTAGKAVLAINVFSGVVEKAFEGLEGMDYSFPSSVAVVDEDGNGLVDKVYAGDLGGQMWRFGKFVDSTGTPLDFPNADENVANWTGQIIFSAGCAEANCGNHADDNGNGEVDERRKFFYPPSVTLEKGYDLLFMGTGDREDACNPIAFDRIYCVKDEHLSGSYTEADLVDVTSPPPVPNLDEETGDADQNGLPDRGWFIRLATGEKVLEQGLVIDKVLYLPIYTPGGGVGEGRLYALKYKTGQPALFLDEENNPTRFKTVGGGIPSRPSMVINQSGRKLLTSTANADDTGQSLGAGILALEPAFPPVNFFYLWWKEL